MHLAGVTSLNCWGHEGRSFWTLLGCFGEQWGGRSVWLVFPCLGSMTGSSYGRTRMEKQFMIYIQTWGAAVSCSQATTVCWSFYSAWPVAMAASKEKQTLKADSVWQLRVSFHRAPWCCVVLCCGWFVLLTKSWSLRSSCQHSESSSLDQSSQQAEKNKPHSV